MKLNTYTYNFNKGTATISNERRYWKLSVELNEERSFLFLDQKIFNTKKGALAYITDLMNKYKLA